MSYKRLKEDDGIQEVAVILSKMPPEERVAIIGIDMERFANGLFEGMKTERRGFGVAASYEFTLRLNEWIRANDY